MACVALARADSDSHFAYFALVLSCLQAREIIDKRLNPILEVVKSTGCSIITDGWSNVKRRPLLNFLVATPKGIKFLRAIDTSGRIKHATYMASCFAKVI